MDWLQRAVSRMAARLAGERPAADYDQPPVRFQGKIIRYYDDKMLRPAFDTWTKHSFTPGDNHTLCRICQSTLGKAWHYQPKEQS